jgi:plasmid replication initiation protein
MEADPRPNDKQSLLFKKRPTNYQPNVFTESRQEFTELEKKIVVIVVNQIGHMSIKGDIQPGTNLVFHVPFSELTKKNHSIIADAAITLQSKRLLYRNDKSEQLDVITPFPRVRFDRIDNKKVIEVTMFADVVPHFAELGQRYTKYDIDVMLSLKSVYAQRMFEIVSMYHNRGQLQFNYKVDRLMEILNCPEGYTFNDFRRNALLVAQRELRDTAGIFLDWTPIKKEVKRIVELTFSIKTSRQLAVEAVDNHQQQINKMTINEAVITAHQLIKNYKLKDWQRDLITSEYHLLETFLRVNSELESGLRTNIKNPTAYLIKSLGIDQMKAPRKTKNTVSVPVTTQGPSLRTSEPKSIQSLFGDILPPK